MHHIALCDDEPLELRKTELLLDAYRRAHSDYNFAVQQFTSVSALWDGMLPDSGFDLLLLDIYLPDKTGIEGAKKLREQGIDCPIIFLTASTDHAVDAFEVDAVQYLIKPLEQTRFFAAMDKAFACLEDERLKYIALRSDGELRRVALRDIVFCESHANYQYITLADGAELRVRATLAELNAQMSDSSAFVRVGAAYLVNMRHVDSISSRELLLDNHRQIGVPRGTYSTLKKRYFEFYCSEKDT